MATFCGYSFKMYLKLIQKLKSSLLKQQPASSYVCLLRTGSTRNNGSCEEIKQHFKMLLIIASFLFSSFYSAKLNISLCMFTQN